METDTKPKLNKYRTEFTVTHNVEADKTDVVAIATQMFLNDVPEATVLGCDLITLGPVHGDSDDVKADTGVEMTFALGESQFPDERTVEQGNVNEIEKIGEVDPDDL